MPFKDIQELKFNVFWNALTLKIDKDFGPFSQKKQKQQKQNKNGQK